MSPTQKQKEKGPAGGLLSSSSMKLSSFDDSNSSSSDETSLTPDAFARIRVGVTH